MALVLRCEFAIFEKSTKHDSFKEPKWHSVHFRYTHDGLTFVDDWNAIGCGKTLYGAKYEARCDYRGTRYSGM
jgi:hypothetical protein